MPILIRSTLVIVLVLGLSLPSMAGDEPRMAVQFEQFPAKNIFNGKPAVPRLEDPDSRLHRTLLRRGATSGPNFAGEYTIVEYGCGSCADCFFIVNARTGQVYKSPFYLSCHFKEGVPGYGLVALDYRLDSNLLIARGARNEQGGGEYYYQWENNQFNLIKSLEEPTIQ